MHLLVVVDTERRADMYVDLLDGFAAYAADHPEHLPVNAVTLSVASRERFDDVDDPMDRTGWRSVILPAGPGNGCVLHHPDHTPANQYMPDRRQDDQ